MSIRGGRFDDDPREALREAMNGNVRLPVPRKTSTVPLRQETTRSSTPSTAPKLPAAMSWAPLQSPAFDRSKASAFAMSSATNPDMRTPTDSSSVYPPPSWPPPVTATMHHLVTPLTVFGTSHGPPETPLAIPEHLMLKKDVPASWYSEVELRQCRG